MKKIILLLVIAAVAAAGYFFYKKYSDAGKNGNGRLVSGNGRLEATEVSIATKLAGRIEEVMVNEGDFVTRGQPLARMQTNVLEAQLAQAQAQHSRAVTAEASARATIEVRLSEKEAAKAVVLQKKSGLDGARKRYERLKLLDQADAAIEVAKAEAAGAAAAIEAADADIARIQADIDDSLLTAPREGRIQYRIAQPGEVLSAGGRVLNLVDLTDVYMTFFLPEEVAGKVSLGADVRLVFDAIPDIPIPAEVSYVASVAQFTPKTVETQSERQKLMFRVKARIDPALLRKYIKLVKTGIPGVTWVKLDPAAEWPEALQLKKREL